jgi:hypothetical protein
VSGFSKSNSYIAFIINLKKEGSSMAMLSGSLVTMAWNVLRFRMEETAPDMKGSCE